MAGGEVATLKVQLRTGILQSHQRTKGSSVKICMKKRVWAVRSSCWVLPQMAYPTGAH